MLVLDSERGVVHEILEDRSLNSSPTWSPDGETVIWSSDRSGVLNLYAAQSAGGSPDGRAGPGGLRQVTDLLTGGTFPAVDPVGEWIYLSVLSEDGWEIGRVRFDPSTWFDPLPVDPRYAAGGAEALGANRDQDSPEALAGAEARDYSALRPCFRGTGFLFESKASRSSVERSFQSHGALVPRGRTWLGVMSTR